MKKVLCMLVTFAMVICTCAYAAEITIKDAANDVITVKGEAPKGAIVTVAVINPEFTVADVGTSGEMALQFYGKTVAGDNGFEVDAKLTDPHNFGGGTYSLIYSTKDETNTQEFGFYFFQKKLDEISALNSEGPEGRIGELYKVYSLDNHRLLSLVDEDTIEKLLALKENYEPDVDKMYETLLENLCIAAYADGVSELVKDGYLDYTDVVGIDSELVYDDYLNSINESGVKAVNDAVLGGDYETAQDIKTVFVKSALLNYITNYNTAETFGYGHITDMFADSEYADELSKFGLDTTKIKNVKNKNYVYKKLSASTDKTFEALVKTYNQAIKDADGESSSGGGGGGGGGSGSSSISLPSDPVEKPVVSGNETNAGYVENTTVPFTDMESAQWATDAVAYLYRRGIISGKSESTFDPSATVTREEFAKMAVLAFVGKADATHTSFTDISGWSMPYIATAVERGIVTGVSESLFNPKGNITREQAATIIARSMTSAGFAFEKEAKEFKDDGEMSQWAKDSIGLLAAEEIISGRENKMFYPGENMTRAEAAKLIYEAMKRTGGAN